MNYGWQVRPLPESSQAWPGTVAKYKKYDINHDSTRGETKTCVEQSKTNDMAQFVCFWGEKGMLAWS